MKEWGLRLMVIGFILGIIGIDPDMVFVRTLAIVLGALGFGMIVWCFLRGDFNHKA